MAGAVFVGQIDQKEQHVICENFDFACPSAEFLLPVSLPFLRCEVSAYTPIPATETASPSNPTKPSPSSPTSTRFVMHPLPSPFPSSTGTLVVEIVYTGQWYRETFNYQPDAANIRHVVLVMPVDSIIQLAGAGWAFSNLKFTPSPEPLSMREEAVEFIPILDFMYDAPGGVASIDLAPGKYNAAVAFIAAALPPPGDDLHFVARRNGRRCLE